MKALSVRQPWAELIIQGRKTIELRTWPTQYRGSIALHVSQTIDTEACQSYGFDPKQLPTGVIMGTVEICDMIEFDAETWQALQPQHLKQSDYQAKYVGWQLMNPQRLPVSIPQKGGRRLFEVDETRLTPTNSVPPPLKVRPPTPIYQMDWEKQYDPDKPFELRVIPHQTKDSYNLAIYQWQVDPTASDETIYQPLLLVELAGAPLQLVADEVMRTLRQAGYKTTDISAKRRTPFRFSEELGVRLALLFLTIKPLSRVDRIEAIANGIQTMPSEEAYYWFSKCMATVNAQRALRILLSGD